MKLTERMALIKAGYTKSEIAEMEKETLNGDTISESSGDERLDTIAQAIVKMNERIDKINIIHSATESGNNETKKDDIFSELRGIIENKPETKEDK